MTKLARRNPKPSNPTPGTLVNGKVCPEEHSEEGLRALWVIVRLDLKGFGFTVFYLNLLVFFGETHVIVAKSSKTSHS